MDRTHGVTHSDPDNCYGCKVKGLATSFGSVRGVLQGAQGRNNFHGDTVSTRRRAMIEEARSKGTVPVELTRRERDRFNSGDRI